MEGELPARDVVLLGVGHTHAHVLRMWRMEPIRGVRLTCISDFPTATYSGMLPGVLAGLYAPNEMEIDVVRLAAAAGARLIVEPVAGVDVAGRKILFAERPPLPFDVLSIGIGSVPDTSAFREADDTLVAIKPMQTFVERLRERLVAVNGNREGRPLRIVIVGAGAGGVEIAFCLPARVRRELGDVPLELTLVDGAPTIGTGMAPPTREIVSRLLTERGVRIETGARVVAVAGGSVELEGGRRVACDVAILATHAAAPRLLERVDLPKDDRGFLLTRPTLLTTADAPVFVVGDTGTIATAPRPKAGVYAVREGPILWQNLRRSLRDAPLLSYEPQREFLRLFNAGDGSAVLDYFGRAAHGRLAWLLKDRIDRRFVGRYRNLAPMPPAATPMTSVMRCAGCGGKVSPTVLTRVLDDLHVGRGQAEDAALLPSPEGSGLAVTTDFFTAPLDDPFLTGRIAALNALSDLFAVGSTPTAALAQVTIPPGPAAQQETLLRELLAGGLRELRVHGVELVGGHTTEGPRVALGFTVLGAAGGRALRGKDALRPGDRLVLGKALGTGVLLAAHMRARCDGAWMETLLASMLASNASAAEQASRFAVRAATDVTGFGLAGHLLEMLRASRLGAAIDLASIPLLPGVADCLAEGIESTLAPANRAAESLIDGIPFRRPSAAWDALFDPQTSGGLLLAVAAPRAEALVSRLRAESGLPATVIGEVVEGEPRIRIV